MTAHAWGSEQTKYFFALTPERVLAAVESAGLRCTGRCQALNSFENRVFDVELETADGAPPPTPVSHRRVVKFYRPGRWTRAQIEAEHQFLFDLRAAEIPAIAPLRFPDGQSIQTNPEGIFYSLFPKVGGRAPDELNDEKLRWLGRLLARIHQVGAERPAPERIALTPETYGIANLDYLLDAQLIPPAYRGRYEDVVRKICDKISPWFADAAKQGLIHRIHGDCHLGNLLWGSENGVETPFFLDFDDMVRGPAVQDLWLLLPDRNRERLERLLEGYEAIRAFERNTLRLIEPLRALRFIHYTGWVARRWDDPAFPLAFPEFGSHRYWNDETEDLERQWTVISNENPFAVY